MNADVLDKAIWTKVDCIEIGRFGVTLKNHSVHLTQVIAIFCHQFVNVACDKHWNPVFFCSSFESACHVDTWTQIAGINLEF